MTNVLAVIPARGGSKGVPRKNIMDICGKPLIAYTIEAALKSKLITDIIVSTDDEEIANVATEYGGYVPFLRPEELADDNAPTYPTVIHALEEMERIKNKEYDAVLLLQPTTPLRKSHHIDRAINLLTSNSSDSVVSVVQVTDSHPFRMKRLVANQLINFIDQGFEDMRPRQSLPPVYLRNGAIYLIYKKSLYAEESLVGKNCLGMVMEENESVNIDGQLDCIVAEALLNREQN